MVFLSLFSLLFSMKIQTLRRSDALGTPNLKRDVSNSHVEASELIGKLKRKIDSGKGSLKSVNEALWYANRLSDWRLALDLFFLAKSSANEGKIRPLTPGIYSRTLSTLFHQVAVVRMPCNSYVRLSRMAISSLIQ